jgi:hypothetical protein
MWNHVGNHNFLLLLAAPATAMAMAYCASGMLVFLQARAGNPFWRVVSIVVVAPILLMLPLVSAARQNIVRDRSRAFLGFLPAIKRDPSLFAPDAIMRYAGAVRSSTPPGSIVFTPLGTSAVPYYSDRRFVRVIENDADLARALPLAQRAFPGAPFYLALQPDGAPSPGLFREALGRSAEIARTPDALIFRLE